MSTQPRTSKGRQTRERLLDTALECFASEGYKAASMRVIASKAGVSLSHAYYYFGSKEDILAQLLLSLRQQQYEQALPAFDEGNTLESNIRSVFNAALETMTPYHDFGPAFLKVLLSQSAANDQIAALELSLWEQAVASARPLPPLNIRRDLPRFLWLLSRQLLSSWAYDQSDGQRRSRRLLKSTAPVVAKFAVLCRLPVVRSLFTDVLSLMDQAAEAQQDQAGAQQAVWQDRKAS